MRVHLGLLLSFVAAAGAVDAATIYRCNDSRGGVLYADSPCASGSVLDVPQGHVDPAAIERLQRALADFEQRQAKREAAAAEQASRRQAQLAAERYRLDEEARLRADEERRAAQYYYAYPYFAVPVFKPPRNRADVPARPLRPRAFLPAR